MRKILNDKYKLDYILHDIFNEYPYELNMVPYGKDEGICLFKYDHLLVDGLGIIASLCLAADNFSENTYPKIMEENILHLSVGWMNVKRLIFNVWMMMIFMMKMQLTSF